MPKPPKLNPAREQRIAGEIVVDAYTPEERAMGWYYYLEEKLAFPFKAKCVAERPVSPLKKGEEVQVLGLAKEDDCMAEHFRADPIRRPQARRAAVSGGTSGSHV